MTDHHRSPREKLVNYNWRVTKQILAVGLLLAIAALLVGCFPSHPQSTFYAAGPVAEKQLNLFLLIFWAAVVVFVVVIGMLLYALIRFRRKAGQEFPKQVHGNTRLEIAWTIAPALVLAMIAVPTIDVIFDTANPPPGEVLEVNVTAHQWWWEFEYPELGVVTANELHVPINEAVDVTLESGDVIHSFWIPKLAGKTDVVPNNVNTLWFEATEPGTYLGLCAEFCGTAHALMRFRVIAQEPAEFDAWVARQKTSPTPPTEDLASQGRLTFGMKACGVCHTANGPEPAGMQQNRMDAFFRGEGVFPAPNLTHFGSRTTLAAGILDLTEDNLRQWLRDPDDVKPGNRMKDLASVYQDPNMSLSEHDISALVAYLQSLK